MDQIASKPAQPGADSGAGKPTPASATEAGPTHNQQLAGYSRRITTALAAIEVNQPSSARALLSGYYRFITTAPSMIVQADTHFPRTVRQHPMNAERSTEYGNKYLLLYFHVGNAILALYDSVEPPLAEVLESRTALLEEIATLGLDKFFIIGDDRDGYRLARSRKVERASAAAV